MIRPIKTAYKGTTYRSRLEGRWAVFFDSLDIKFVYEKEWVKLGCKKRYLPDFWLPHTVEELASEGWGLWVEIKPLEGMGLDKVIALAEVTKHNALLIQGKPFPGAYTVTKVSSRHFIPPRVINGLEFVQEKSGYVHLMNSEGFTSYPVAFRDLDLAYKAANLNIFEEDEW